jgi:hypothetical protein
MHGGAGPSAKTKAEAALALARMPAIEALYRSTEVLRITVEQFMEDTCATCGYPKGDADEKKMLIRACRNLASVCTSVLDRTGMGPHASLEIKQNDGDLDPRTFTDDERQNMVALLAQLKTQKQAIRARLHAVSFGVSAPSTQII